MKILDSTNPILDKNEDGTIGVEDFLYINWEDITLPKTITDGDNYAKFTFVITDSKNTNRKINLIIENAKVIV